MSYIFNFTQVKTFKGTLGSYGAEVCIRTSTRMEPSNLHAISSNLINRTDISKN